MENNNFDLFHFFGKLHGQIILNFKLDRKYLLLMQQ